MLLGPERLAQGPDVLKTFVVRCCVRVICLFCASRGRMRRQAQLHPRVPTHSLYDAATDMMGRRVFLRLPFCGTHRTRRKTWTRRACTCLERAGGSGRSAWAPAGRTEEEEGWSAAGEEAVVSDRRRGEAPQQTTAKRGGIRGAAGADGSRRQATARGDAALLDCSPFYAPPARVRLFHDHGPPIRVAAQPSTRSRAKLPS